MGAPRSFRIYSPFFPAPPVGGSEHVIYEQARYFVSLGSALELVCWKSPAVEHHVGSWNRVTIRSVPAPADRRLLRLGRAIVKGLASPELYYYPPMTLPSFGEVDLGIYHYSFAYPWLLQSRQRERRRVVMFHNLESDLFEQRARSGNLAARWIHERNTRILRQHESHIAGLVDELWFISPADLDTYRARNPRAINLRLTPPIFPPELRRMRGRVTQGRTVAKVLGFAGALDFGPNQDSVRWMMRELCPRLLRAGFTGELRIAGRGAPAWLARESAAFPFVKILGFVSDMEGFFSDLTAVLSPHVSGSGVRLKLLEAVASGIPVLTHPEALGQLAPELRVGSAIFASVSADEWVARLQSEEAFAWRRSLGSREMEPALRGDSVYGFLS